MAMGLGKADKVEGQTTMSAQATELVTKREALEKVIHFLDKPGCMDVEPVIELLTWQTKLVLWLLQEGATNIPIKEF
jgi:hypothetical protein